MAFSFYLECNPLDFSDNVSHGELEDLQDYAYLAMMASGLLEEAGCRFHMSGFGVDSWAMNVGYDMSSLVEQLPELLSGVRGGEFVEVDLYSQGIECMLKFFPDGKMVRIECESRTEWTPDPRVESLEQCSLEDMISRLAIDFSKGVDACNSPISRIEPFSKWVNGEV